MGVKGNVWQLFNCVKTDVTIPQLTGCTIAIDAPMWLVPFEQKTEASFSLEYAFISKLIPLLENGVRPVVVFEGNTMVAAKQTTKMERLKRSALSYDPSEALKKAVTTVSRSQKGAHSVDDFGASDPKRNRTASLNADDDDNDSDIIYIEGNLDQFKPYAPNECEEKNQDTFFKLLAITKEKVANPVSEKTTEEFCKSQLRNAVHHGRAAQSIEKIRGGRIKSRASSKSPDVEIIEKEVSEYPLVHNRTELTLDVFTKKMTHSNPSIASTSDSAKLSENATLCDSNDRRNTVLALVMSLIGDDGTEQSVACSTNDESSPLKDLTPEKELNKKKHELSKVNLGFIDSSSESDDDMDKEWYPMHPEADIEPNRDPGDEKSNINKYELLKLMLAALGVPYVEAPAEAEAQCIQLKRMGLVDVIASEDSDVIPLGTPSVIRHLCSSKESPHYYAFYMLPNGYKMSNAFWIVLATLVGCDYAIGVKGCGVVLAAELLLEIYPVVDLEDNTDKKILYDFVSYVLEKVKNWIRHPDSHITETLTRLRPKFKGLDVNTLRIPQEFISPVVNESKVPFVFSKGNYARLEHLLITGGVPVKKAKMLRLSVEKWNKHVSSHDVNSYNDFCWSEFDMHIKKNQDSCSEFYGTRLTKAFMRYVNRKESQEDMKRVAKPPILAE